MPKTWKTELYRVIGKNKIGPSPASLPSYHMMTLREAPRGKPTILNTRNLRHTPANNSSGHFTPHFKKIGLNFAFQTIQQQFMFCLH